MTTTVLERIEAGEKQVADIFSDNYAFTIPPYQRPYAWEIQQASELFDDLLDAMAPNSHSKGLFIFSAVLRARS